MNRTIKNCQQSVLNLFSPLSSIGGWDNNHIVHPHANISIIYVTVCGTRNRAATNVRRGEATVPWSPPQTLKIKNVKTTLSKTCFQNAQKCVCLGVILQNFPGGTPPDPPRMVVSSALPLKLICDVTRLWRNLPPPQKFSSYATARSLG